MRQTVAVLFAMLLLGVGVANAATTNRANMHQQNQGDQFNWLEGGGG